MKYIRKKKTPSNIERERNRWLKNQPTNPDTGLPINCGYDAMDAPLKATIKKSLLAEQGWLCCYTGMLIDFDTFHIEHLIPQNLSRELREQGVDDYRDTDYQNMLAAYPRKDHCEFGARARGDKPLKIHPLQPNCETRFRFDSEGHISPSNSRDKAAQDTIDVLHLDHGKLDGMRRLAIDEALFPNSHALSKAKLKTLIQEYCKADATGHFPKFCFVIAQVAQNQLHRAERDRKRRTAIHNRGRK